MLSKKRLYLKLIFTVHYKLFRRNHYGISCDTNCGKKKPSYNNQHTSFLSLIKCIPKNCNIECSTLHISYSFATHIQQTFKRNQLLVQILNSKLKKEFYQKKFKKNFLSLIYKWKIYSVKKMPCRSQRQH